VGRKSADGNTVVVDCGLAEPLRQRHRVDPEIRRDSLERDTVGPAPSDLHDVVAELLWEWLGHSNILPGLPSGQARSDVTPPRGSPTTALRV